jgi:hypothetical protein
VATARDWSGQGCIFFLCGLKINYIRGELQMCIYCGDCLMAENWND